MTVDPTVKHGSRSLLPVVWTEDMFSSTREFWEEARGFGLRHGWSKSTFDSNGVGGLLTLVRSAEPLSEAELREKALMMDWLTQATHLCMTQCLTAKLMPELTAGLSEREITILRWTAEGKTAREIAELLRIAKRTVEFHIANATVKLNASNKTAACIRAAVLGLLY